MVRFNEYVYANAIYAGAIVGFTLGEIAGTYASYLYKPPEDWVHGLVWCAEYLGRGFAVSAPATIVGLATFPLAVLAFDTIGMPIVESYNRWSKARKKAKEEVQILEKQLTIAKNNNDFPVILHTPGNNKRVVTKQLIELIDSYEISNGVIDHVSSDNIDMTLNTKLYVGLTTQKGKLSIDEFLHIIDEFGDLTNRFIINSDLGIDIAHRYIVPKAIQRLMDHRVDKAVVEAISHENAEKLFQIK